MDITASLILWFVVFPLSLILLTLVYRTLYRRHVEKERRRSKREALQRYDENRRKIKNSWKL